MPRRPKVAHVTTSDISLRYLLLDQMQYLADAGYDVHGISATGGDVAAIEAAGFSHSAVSFTRRMTPLTDLRALVELVWVMRREGYDIVHTHTPKAGLLGQLAARIAGVPTVVNTIHGFYFHEGTPEIRRRVLVALERLAALCSDAILMQSAEDVDTAQRLGIGRPETVSFLGNGIDLTRFDPQRITASQRMALRRDLGVPGDAPVVGFLGRLVAEKGVPELLDAMIHVRRRRPGTRLVLIGPVDEAKADAITSQAAAQRGLADSCVFTGMRDDVPELLSVLDVFVLPSHREGFPRSLMEASAMGVACVATDVRGCREAVRPDVNGLLVPVRDAQSLAAAIVRLLADDTLRHRLGRGGRAEAERRFDQRRVFERVLDTYRVLAEPARPRPAVVPG